MMTYRWAPPLPTIGRVGPRILVEPSSTLEQRLEDYFCENRSVADVFERRIQPFFLERFLGTRSAPAFLSDLCPRDQQQVLLRNLYVKVSQAFKVRLRRRLDAGRLNQVRSWFHTATAAVLAYYCTSDHPSEAQVDRLTRWALENCANNYAQFQSDFKSLKKGMRKSFALTGRIDSYRPMAHMVPYYDLYKSKVGFESPAELGRYVLTWCQTRATGMADHVMIRKSLEKFKRTVQEPSERVLIPEPYLLDATRMAVNTMGVNAVVSVGTTACLESSRGKGGKTAFLKDTLAKKRVLRFHYNMETLEPTAIDPRPVRTPHDVLSWAVQTVLHHPTYVRCVRVHAVVEPSKARTITVAPYAYQVIMGVLAHMYQATLQHKHVKSGLKADRHLWRFVQKVLNPQSAEWQHLPEGATIYALSTDLSEATDFGNLTVSSQIWQFLIKLSSVHEGFPRALAVLGKTLYNGKRFFFVPDQLGNYQLVSRQRGWMMGDMMTKVILTIAHDAICRMSRLQVYSLVGDDEIALSASVHQLSTQIDNLQTIFKVSEEDTYISCHLAFYCEEGTLVPQRASSSNHVQMRRGEELSYLDYPRFRLLLPQISEVDAYSMSNSGRFALLGKESRWVDNVNPKARKYFTRASLLQHILVPQEPDCISPYIPIEIGGDGAMPHSPGFLARVVADKSRNAREVMYRMASLMSGTTGHRYVRSDRTDKVVHKHHLYLPKMEGLRELLPADSVIKPNTEEGLLLLRSLKVDNICTPERAFFKLAKAAYYRALLAGLDPPEPTFSLERSYSAGHTEDPYVNFPDFLEAWKNPGFVFQDSYDYFVDLEALGLHNPMQLGWRFGPTAQIRSGELFSQWVRDNLTLEDQGLPDVLDSIRNMRPLPDWVMARLNLYIESDNYIMMQLRNRGVYPRFILVVTRDKKLCIRMQRWLTANGHTSNIILFDPAIYMMGRLTDIESVRVFTWYKPFEGDVEFMLDPGAMLHVDYTEFTDGFPNEEDYFDRPIEVLDAVPRHPDVVLVRLAHARN